MRSPLLKISVAVCLLLLVIVTPRPNVRITETSHYTSSRIDWTSINAEAAKRRAELDRWYAAAASKPVVLPQAKPRAEGMTGAQAKQEAAYEAGSMEALVCSIFVDSCGRAVRVFTCESGLNPNARNRSGASGIAQIMLPMHADLFDAHGWDWHDSWMVPYRNLIVAFDLSSGGTRWGGWVCR